MPGGDLIAPAGDGATEALNLGRARIVLEVDAELGDELVGQLRVACGSGSAPYATPATPTGPTSTQPHDATAVD